MSFLLNADKLYPPPLEAVIIFIIPCVISKRIKYNDGLLLQNTNFIECFGLAALEILLSGEVNLTGAELQFSLHSPLNYHQYSWIRSYPKIPEIAFLKHKIKEESAIVDRGEPNLDAGGTETLGGTELRKWNNEIKLEILNAEYAYWNHCSVS